jgi:hypothetical protein
MTDELSESKEELEGELEDELNTMREKAKTYTEEVDRKLDFSPKATSRLERTVNQIAAAGGYSSEERNDLATAIASRLQESKLTVAGALPEQTLPIAGATVRWLETTNQEQVLLPVFGEDQKTRYVFSLLTDPECGPSGDEVVEDIGTFVKGREIMYSDYSLVRITGRRASEIYHMIRDQLDID